MKRALLLVLGCWLLVGTAQAQWFGSSNASRLQGSRIKNPLACTDAYVLTWVTANLQFECLAGTSATGGAVGGASSLTNVSSVPFITSSGVLTQDTGFSFNATATVTPSAGEKRLNLASSTVAAAITFTSTNLPRGSFGAVNGDGIRWADQGGSVVINGTYSTNNLQVGGATDAGYKFDITTSGTNGALRSPNYNTTTNCASSGGTCGAAAAGSVSIAAAATTVTVATTAVTANSTIFLQDDSSLGTKLGVTCNTTVPTAYSVTARTAATSFVITATAPITNPACFNYWIVN